LGATLDVLSYGIEAFRAKIPVIKINFAAEWEI
jgi:hypothetical protein